MLIEPILRFCLESMLIWPATKRTVWQRDFQFEKALRAWNQIISLLPLSRSHQPSLYIRTPMTPILKPTTPLPGRRPPSVRTRGRQRRTRTRSIISSEASLTVGSASYFVALAFIVPPSACSRQLLHSKRDMNGFISIPIRVTWHPGWGKQ